MDALRHEDDWRRVAEEHFLFSVDNICKYFARSPPLSAQDADGWRPREHVAFLFSEDDEEFHNLIQKHMVMLFILGDFFLGHSEEVAGGKYFALVKPNADGAPFPNAGAAFVDADVRGIVIGSTWRRCSASLAVDESSLAVADYLLSQYDNFLQFAGQKDGTTRCAQIVQLSLANHVDHDVSDPLVAVQLDASNAFCSVSRQPQFDVLAGKASRSYDDGRVQLGDELPRPRTLDKYWGYFWSMQGNAYTMRFSDNQGVTHHLPCSKGGQQGDGLETIRFAVTVHPSCERHLECKVLGICDDILILARLSKALSCAADMKKILKAALDMDLNVPKFNVFFPDASFSLDTARSALDRAVRADAALADLAAMGAGVSTDDMRVAGVPVGVDAWVKTFVAKKARSVITVVASSVQDLMPN